jgi:hypothetical protein
MTSAVICSSSQEVIAESKNAHLLRSSFIPLTITLQTYLLIRSHRRVTMREVHRPNCRLGQRRIRLIIPDIAEVGREEEDTIPS